MKEETTELGMTVPVAEHEVEALERKLRGQFDLSRLEQRSPALIRCVEWLLSVPGMGWDTIANNVGISWNTVAAIASRRGNRIEEFKARNAAAIALILEAAGPGLLAKAKDGKLAPFDYKILVDAFLLLSGEATSRVEHVHRLAPEEEELMRFLSSKPVQMGCEGGEKLALGPGAEVASGAGSERQEEAGTVVDVAAMVHSQHNSKD